MGEMDDLRVEHERFQNGLRRIASAESGIWGWIARDALTGRQSGFMPERPDDNKLTVANLDRLIRERDDYKDRWEILGRVSKRMIEKRTEALGRYGTHREHCACAADDDPTDESCTCGLREAVG